MAAVATAAAATRHAEPEPPVPLTADLIQHRTGQVARAVEIQLRNGGDAPIHVVRAELRSPSFTGAGPIDTDALVMTGDVRTDIRIGYGEGICTGPAATLTAAPATAVLTIAAGERTRTVELALPYPSQLLNYLLRTDCEQAEVRQVATAALTGLTPRPDGALDAAITLTRTGGTAPVAVTDLKGSVLYTLTPVASTKPYGTLAAGQATVDIPIVVALARCDPHAIGEVKKPYEFPVWITVGDGPPVYTMIEVAVPDQDTLFALLRKTC